MFINVNVSLIAESLGIPGEWKKFTRLVGCEIKSTRPILKTEMLIYLSTVILDEKICLVNHSSFRPRN